MRHTLFIFIVVALLLSLPTSPSLAAINVDLFGGASVHGNVPIQIGAHHIDEPRWETRPWSSPPYYSVRVRWSAGEIELLHDKVYMGYDTPSVVGFNMSDGYNMLFYNFIWERNRWETRLGIGPVIVHPEGKIDSVHIGSHGDRHFRLGGLGGQLAVGYRHALQKGFSFIAEGKLTAGYTQLHIADVGELRAPVTGLHLLLGIGYEL